MALVQDHFVINIARTRQITFGGRREFEHHFRVELPAGRTRKEAVETFTELKGKYLSPEYSVGLMEVVCRGSMVAGE